MLRYTELTFNDVAKENPVAEDIKIQALQEELMDRFSWLDIAFGRVYPNDNRKGKKIPEIYVGQDQYAEVFPDSSVKGMSFFHVKESYEPFTDNFDSEAKVDVDLIFFVNLSRTHPSVKHRADAEVRRDAEEVVRQWYRGWQYQSTEVGVDNVFRDFDYEFSQPIVDMQPFFVFSLKLQLTYDLLTCEC